MDSLKRTNTVAIFCFILFGSKLNFNQAEIIELPDLPMFVKVNEKTAEKTGYLASILNRSVNKTFEIQTYSTQPNEFDFNECFNSLSVANNKNKLCLFQYVPGLEPTMNMFQTPDADSLPFMTRPVAHIELVLITNNCPRRTYSKADAVDNTDENNIDLIFYMRVFHSSVWSLLLLFYLTTTAMLYVYEHIQPPKESTYPLKHKPSLNLQDSFRCTMLGLFLQGYHKSPRSWAGIVLTITWYAFCLINIIIYGAGMYTLLCNPYHANKELVLPTNTSTIKCYLNKELCESISLKWNNQTSIQWKNSIREIENSTENSILLTNQLVANYLIMTKQQNSKWCKLDELSTLFSPICDSTEWISVKQELTFLTKNIQSLWYMNNYLMKLESQNTLEEINRFWLGGDDLTLKNQCSFDLRPDQPKRWISIPIRLNQMYGVLLFIIAGTVFSILIYMSEFIYYLLTKDEMEKEYRKKQIAKTVQI